MKRFSHELNELIRLSNKSASQVAEHGRVDRAYLSRLQSGEKSNPSPETIMRLWIGIVFDEKLLAAHPEMIWGLEKLILSAVWSAAGDKLLSDAGAVSS